MREEHASNNLSPASPQPALLSASSNALTPPPSAPDVDVGDKVSPDKIIEKQVHRPKPAVIWQLAYERAAFDEGQKSEITKSKAKTEKWNPLKFVEQVKDQTRVRSEECERSGWIDKTNKKIAFAQQAETILTAVVELKGFVSAGLKFDVTGYGAVAWSVINIGLQVRCFLSLRYISRH
jgi:hypothetical protein